MSMWLMYLVLKLDDIANGLKISCGIGLAIFIVTLVIFIFCSLIGAEPACYDDTMRVKKAIRPLFKWAIPILIVSFLLHIVLPTTKQAAAIYFVPKVINNKEVRKMPSKLVTLANDWMDEQIKSIKQVGK